MSKSFSIISFQRAAAPLRSTVVMTMKSPSFVQPYESAFEGFLGDHAQGYGKAMLTYSNTLPHC